HGVVFSGGPDVGRLKTLGSLRHLEGHLLALFERLESVHLNGGEVDEHVLAVLAGDEPVALFVTKPLDRSAGHWQLPPFLQSSARATFAPLPGGCCSYEKPDCRNPRRGVYGRRAKWGTLRSYTTF